MAKVINFTGEPSSGKSTAAMALYAQMKQQGYSVEIITEYAKTLAYQSNNLLIQDQMYVFAQQNNLMFILANGLNSGKKVDYIITDSPLYLSCIYGKFHQQNQSDMQLPVVLPDSFFQMVMDTYKQFDNANIIMQRKHQFAFDEGRLHDEKFSKLIKTQIQELMQKHDISAIEFETKDLEQDVNLGKSLFNLCLDNNIIQPLNGIQYDNGFYQSLCEGLRHVVDLFFTIQENEPMINFIEKMENELNRHNAENMISQLNNIAMSCRGSLSGVHINCDGPFNIKIERAEYDSCGDEGFIWNELCSFDMENVDQTNNKLVELKNINKNPKIKFVGDVARL